MKTIVTISKVHFEPYPIQDVITSWEFEEDNSNSDARFWMEFLKQVVFLMQVFDTPSEWNYEIANAVITFDDHELQRRMPYWNELPDFIKALTEFSVEVSREEPFDWDSFLAEASEYEERCEDIQVAQAETLVGM